MTNKKNIYSDVMSKNNSNILEIYDEKKPHTHTKKLNKNKKKIQKTRDAIDQELKRETILKLENDYCFG